MTKLYRIIDKFKDLDGKIYCRVNYNTDKLNDITIAKLTYDYNKTTINIRLKYRYDQTKIKQLYNLLSELKSYEHALYSIFVKNASIYNITMDKITLDLISINRSKPNMDQLNFDNNIVSKLTEFVNLFDKEVKLILDHIKKDL